MHVEHWTGGTAPAYVACMYKPTLMLPLLFILANDVRCKDDAPTGAQFGEACNEDPPFCADGLECSSGYCAEICETDADCQTIEGFRHECLTLGVCRILCDEKTLACPQTLGTPMKCGVGTCESTL